MGENIEEGRRYLRGKHNFYGLKFEAIVWAKCLVLGVSNQYSVSVSDFKIFHRRKEWHKKKCEEVGGERHINAFAVLCEEYKTYWAILSDIGYQGIK